MIATLEQDGSLNDVYDANSPVTIQGVPIQNCGNYSYGKVTLSRVKALSLNVAYMRLNGKVDPSLTKELAICLGYPENTPCLDKAQIVSKVEVTRSEVPSPTESESESATESPSPSESPDANPNEFGTDTGTEADREGGLTNPNCNGGKNTTGTNVDTGTSSSPSPTNPGTSGYTPPSPGASSPGIVVDTGS